MLSCVSLLRAAIAPLYRGQSARFRLLCQRYRPFRVSRCCARARPPQSRKLPAKDTANVKVCDPAALGTFENMVKLNDLNEPVILHNLRSRYKKNEIYTYVGTILIAVNPFKLLPIYTPAIQDIYKEKGSKDTPPHIYAVSDLAYNNMLADRVNQSIVISGESGAGKTETMKLVLQYLAEVSGRAQKRTSTGETTESLEQQILKSNPVMEAFGNAKTVRNNNSRCVCDLCGDQMVFAECLCERVSSAIARPCLWLC